MPRGFALLSAGILLLPSVANGAAPVHLKVVATTLAGYWFASGVAGAEAEVNRLLPGRVNPHNVQFSPDDLRRLEQADLVVVNGLGLESWLDKTLAKTSKSTRAQLASLAAGIPSGQLIYSTGTGHWSGRADRAQNGAAGPAGWPNPHIWLDPQLAAHSVSNIWRAMAALDPPHASNYARNARA